MALKIKRAAVIGAGWMGASIAALFASAGIDTMLLDVLPPIEPSDDDIKRGITRFSDEWRNSLSIKAIKRAIKRGAFLDSDAVDKISYGNIADNLNDLSQMDLILEAVPEVLEVKQAVYDRIESIVKPNTIITSNTSGIRLEQLLESRSSQFKSQFFISHFFNPVRFMRLMELVSGSDTDQKLVDVIVDFAESKLGKGVIVSNDTPYFIANRIGLYSMITAISHAESMGINVAECDALTGQFLGRASSGTFLTADIIGLDALLLVFDNLHESLVGDYCRERFNVPQFFRQMVEKGFWGDKTCAGFYRRCMEDDPFSSEIMSLKTLEYEKQSVRDFKSLTQAKEHTYATERIKALLSGDDEGSHFAWKVTRDMLNYAARKLDDIADDPITIDRAMRWGYNWELGPFQVWDALGVDYVLERMEKDSVELPPQALEVVNSGHNSWYTKKRGQVFQYYPAAKKMYEVPKRKGLISIDAKRQSNSLMFSDGRFSVIDLDDGVSCLTVAPDGSYGLRVDDDFTRTLAWVFDNVKSLGIRGLILYSEAQDFSPGMDMNPVYKLSSNKEWDGLEKLIEERQKVNLAVKRCGFPIVAAVKGRTYGAGFELAMSCGFIQAHVEARITLNESVIGLIPGGGGCKELLYRAMEKVTVDGPHPLMQHAFDVVMPARKARGAYQAKSMGLLRRIDKFTMGRERLLIDAKNVVISELECGYNAPPVHQLNLPGAGGAAAIDYQLKLLLKAGKIDEHDLLIGQKLAYVLSGGNCSPFDMISEERLIELEREAFLYLCGTKETKRRMASMMKKYASRRES